MPKRIDLTGKEFGDWVVEEYLENSVWRCRNKISNQIKDIHSYDLRTKYLNNKMTYIPKEYEDIKGKQFGEWTALEHLQSGKWKCKCSCGNEGVVTITDLKKGASKRCNNPIHKLKHNLIGQTFGKWKVVEYTGDMRWKCECQCENHTVRDILTRDLINGTSKSCGCDRNYHIIHKDISGQTFNNLKVLEYTGKDNMWRCECLACGNENFITHKDSILTGKTKSCGCLKETLRKETMIERYGDVSINATMDRDRWQMETVRNKTNLERYLDNFKLKNGRKPTIQEIVDNLHIKEMTVFIKIKRYNLRDKVYINPNFSKMETDIKKYIESLGIETIQGNRTILSGKELDIYIPSKKVEVEFNGNYWHSAEHKDAIYHQHKSIECLRKGIHLIHIYEYEWKDDYTRDKIKRYINNELKGVEIDVKNSKISHINEKDAYNFLSNYSLEDFKKSDKYIGCYIENILEGIMAINITDNKCEIIYEHWVNGNTNIEGTSKFIEYIRENYDICEISTDIKLDKYSGKQYLLNGFIIKNIIEPTYKYINHDGTYVLTEEDTAILENRNINFSSFYKIYNAGALKLIKIF